MRFAALELLNDANRALVGGHTGEAQELALGFAINGLIDNRMVNTTRKGGMRVGEILILTKPIGTGTLFVTHARRQALGSWIDNALQSIRHSSQLAADYVCGVSASACTETTAFRRYRC